jgi:membrane-associated PAP2 superfamily phosphatase
LSHSSGLDQRIAAFFYDPLAHGFPAHRWEILETLGHRFAKSAVLGLWLLLLAAALAANWVERLRAQAPLLWVTLIAMALGPTIVVLMKELNGYRCPWDLVQFGGIAEYGSGWFVPRVNAGHCFPSGHAAGGFSLIALFFAGSTSGHEGIRRWGLVIAVGAGCLFSMVRIAQGAHFLSHNLWSAAIDWVVAALVFTPLAVAVLRA